MLVIGDVKLREGRFLYWSIYSKMSETRIPKQLGQSL